MESFFDELLIVLVIYKMKIVESPAYHSLMLALKTSNKSTSLFIYDNSPDAQGVPNESCWEVSYVHNKSNPGVSKAYNEGFKKAKSDHKKWLLLVDQDTVFPSHALRKYEHSVVNATQPIVVPVLIDQFGIVSPFLFKWGRGQRMKFVKRNSTMEMADFFFVNSGVMISLECFESAGGYDEHFPLDFSDLAFNRRLRKQFREFKIIDADCKHHLSALDISYEERLIRFSYYLQASKMYSKLYGDSSFLFLARVLRAARLGFKFSSLHFLRLFFRLEKDQSSMPC